MNQDLSREIYDLADDIANAGPTYARIADLLLTVLHTEQSADGLAPDILRLTGPDSLVMLIALIVEAKTDSKAIRDLPAPQRHAARNELAAITHQLTSLAVSDHAENLAAILNPA